MECENCGHTNSARAKFCEECGTKLQVAPPQTYQPQAYTPRHLADRILRARGAVEGERKDVTVLFADVKGSMKLAEALDDETWHQILDRFFGILGDVIHHYEGTINQYTGDGVMALFGAPLALEDHARRACYAALDLREHLQAYAEDLKRRHGVNFSVRMGLHSGEVVIGRIGDDLRMDYTAQGHTVGLAKRLEQLATPGTAYVSGATARLADGFVTLRDLGGFDVRGVSGSTNVFELLGAGSAHTRFDVSKGRGLSLFVGRELEMERLRQKLARALEGEAQVVSLVGEAGVGKSRLCFEFLEQCRASGIRVAEGHAVSHGQGVPLLPWLSVFRSSFNVDERDDPAEAREKVAGRSVLWDPQLSELLPIVFDFMGIADPDAPAVEMDPDARKRKLLDFVCRASEARNRQQGGVLLWEDLHWLDPASDDMLAGWLEAISATRTLVIANYRPEYHPRWFGAANHEALRIRPLGPKEVRALLTDLLGTHPTVFALPQKIEDRTRGNPFFIEEVVQSLIESGDLRGKRGAYRLETPVRSLAIPGSVRAVLAERIDRLSDDQKSLLQTASVVGKSFAEPVLEKATGLPRSRLSAPLAALQSAEMVLERDPYPVRTFVFKHPLTQEVAYHSQLQERRAKIHRAVARAIADLHAGSLDEKAALLAQHYERGDEALEAARWHGRAALWVGTKDIPEALRHDRRGIELLERVASKPATDRLGGEARARLLHLAWRAGMDDNEEDRLFHQGIQIADRLGDERLRAQITVGFGICLSMRGDEAAREELCREAYERACRTGDEELSLQTLVSLSTALEIRGKALELLELLARHPDPLVRSADHHGFWEFSARTYLIGARGQARAGLGQFPEALQDAEEVTRRARADGRTEARINALLFSAQVHYLAGLTDRAHIDSEQLLDLAEQHGAPTYVGFAHGYAAQAHTLAGEPQAALRHIEQAEGTMDAYGLEGIRPYLGEVAAETYLALGHPDARAIAEINCALARIRGRTREHALALLVLAETSAEEEGLAHLEEAASLLEGAHLSGLLPRVDEAHARWLAHRGDLAGARERYRRAESAWTSLGAPSRAELVSAAAAALET